MTTNAKLLQHEKLLSGYAETSTRRNPRQPETVIVGDTEIANCRCVGSAYIDGRCGWLAFRDRRTGRYYFQYRPW